MADVDVIAKRLGVELLPWQRDLAGRILTGERVVVMRGRRGGMTTVRKVVAEGMRESKG